MTSISGNSAALSILTQASTSPASNKSAADTILDIVSGGSTGATDKAEEARLAKLAAQKAKIAALDQPREAGGTVSSEISAGWTSAMSAVVQGTTLASAATGDPQTDFQPYKATIDNAKTFTAILADKLDGYNAQFELMKAPTREEWTALVLDGEADSISRGQSVADAKKQTELMLSDKVYQSRVEMIDLSNKGTLTDAKNAAEAAGYLAGHLASTFGVNVEISYDESGKAKLGAFDIYYGNGEKMLSYGDDGSLTTYNQDGSILSAMTHKQVITSY